MTALELGDASTPFMDDFLRLVDDFLLPVDDFFILGDDFLLRGDDFLKGSSQQSARRVIVTLFRTTAKKGLETAHPLNSLVARGLAPFVNPLRAVLVALRCG